MSGCRFSTSSRFVIVGALAAGFGWLASSPTLAQTPQARCADPAIVPRVQLGTLVDFDKIRLPLPDLTAPFAGSLVATGIESVPTERLLGFCLDLPIDRPVGVARIKDPGAGHVASLGRLTPDLPPPVPAIAAIELPIPGIGQLNALLSQVRVPEVPDTSGLLSVPPSIPGTEDVLPPLPELPAVPGVAGISDRLPALPDVAKVLPINADILNRTRSAPEASLGGIPLPATISVPLDPKVKELTPSLDGILHIKIKPKTG